MATYYSDLHCHTTLYTFNRGYKHTWHEPFFLWFPALGDFSQIAKGNVRVVMASLYPIEQGFVRLKLVKKETGPIADFMARVIVKIPKKRTDEIQDYNHDYYIDLIKEIIFLFESSDPVKHKVFISPFKRKEFKYRIVSNYTELKDLLFTDNKFNPGPAIIDTIAVVLTVEGAHSLGIGQLNTQNLNLSSLKNKLSKNIRDLKKLGPPGKEGAWCPFFISLDHHFGNQLGGHAVSLWGLIRKALNQTPEINTEITDLGKFVVAELLDNTNGFKRILIDTTHMCIKVRQWYYKYLEKLKERGDHIPVIVSHTAANGIKTMADAEIRVPPVTVHDLADSLYNRSTDFNTWDVFLTDEEIMIIHKSKGIIGLILDKRIIMGKKELNKIRAQRWFKFGEARRALWIEPLIKQILYIASYIQPRTENPEKTWDNISIGSDLNGMIRPLRAFRTANKFPSLNDTMYKELKRNSEKAKPGDILFGKTEADIKEITDKIMWKNNLEFLKKHFK
jgi:hypothetical protein